MTPSLLKCLPALLAGMALLSACAQVQMQSDAATGVRSLRVQGPIDLQLHEGAEEPSETLSAPLRRWVEDGGGTLVLATPEGSRGRIAAQLSLPLLQQISITGGGHVRGGTLRARTVDLQLGGASSLTLKGVTATRLTVGMGGSGDLLLGRVEAESAQARVSGSGHLYLRELRVNDWEASLGASGQLHAAGWAARQRWSLSGSGDVHAMQLDGQEVQLACYGSGDSLLGRSQRLDLRLVGSGDVSYAGVPELQIQQWGSGRAQQRSGG